MDLVWTKSARRDRHEIYEFIQMDSVPAAFKMDSIFAEKAAILTEFPEIGRPGRVPGTRELLAHRHYFLIYRIRGNNGSDCQANAHIQAVAEKPISTTMTKPLTPVPQTPESRYTPSPFRPLPRK